MNYEFKDGDIVGFLSFDAITDLVKKTFTEDERTAYGLQGTLFYGLSGTMYDHLNLVDARFEIKYTNGSTSTFKEIPYVIPNIALRRLEANPYVIDIL